MPSPLIKLLTPYCEFPKLGAQVALQYNVLITVYISLECEISKKNSSLVVAYAVI